MQSQRHKEASSEELDHLIRHSNIISIATQPIKRRNNERSLHIPMLYVVNIAQLTVVLLLLLVYAPPARITSQAETPPFYSPAQNIVQYKTQEFLDNIWHVSDYQGEPDKTKDNLWNSLYQNTSATAIEAHEARLLPNQTMVLPGSGGKAIITLEVFHQLHCLNVIRKTAYPERFPTYSLFHSNGTRDMSNSMHFDHCVDRIRQATMCASDLGTLFWRWRADLGQWAINMSTTHLCRNFDDIREWATERNVADWDKTAPSILTP